MRSYAILKYNFVDIRVEVQSVKRDIKFLVVGANIVVMII